MCLLMFLACLKDCKCYASKDFIFLSSAKKEVDCLIIKKTTCFYFLDVVESELLHTYSKVYKFDVVLLIVRLAVLTAVTLTVPVVLFPVSISVYNHIL